MGPELLHVKDLARKSNSFTETDYRDGLKVLDRIFARRTHGIVIYRNAAGCELVPASSRPHKLEPALMEPPPVDVGSLIAEDGEWTWDKVCRSFPEYKKSDIGFLFYVYDFKFSGEHRVRLVFDGSRQSASTYSETYAPTVRAEPVRLFHIVCVEEGYHIGQYEVPQAFLKAEIDHDIFAYPPKGQSLFPGQILKLHRALYGGKQSVFLWFSVMNVFLMELGFTPSPLDSCLYRRHDALLILYCDDLRIGASPDVLSCLHTSLLICPLQCDHCPRKPFSRYGHGIQLGPRVFEVVHD
jgi:hypothetical protein